MSVNIPEFNGYEFIGITHLSLLEHDDYVLTSEGMVKWSDDCGRVEPKILGRAQVAVYRSVPAFTWDWPDVFKDGLWLTVNEDGRCLFWKIKPHYDGLRWSSDESFGAASYEAISEFFSLPPAPDIKALGIHPSRAICQKGTK